MNVDPERIDVSADREPAVRHLALDACPYLLSRDLRVRHATAWRGHRCTAIEPAAAPSAEKQRRLCLTADHTGCATYIAAGVTSSSFASSSRGDAVPQGRATRWALGRTTPVVEAASPLGELLDRARDNSTQLALAGLLVLALIAVGFGQVGRPPGDGSRPSPSASQPVAVATASPSASPTPTLGPVPTPTPTASPAPLATSTPVPTASTTYTVKAGDTLWDIAIQFGTSVAAIQELNGLGTSTRLVVGQVLKIP